MSNKIFSRLLSVGLSASLLSGYAMLQETAFYVLLIMNIVCWVCWLAISKMELDALRKLTESPLIMWSMTILQIGALVYSQHPALAASSLLCSVFIYSSATARVKKEDAQ